MSQIYGKWFGVEPPKLLDTVTEELFRRGQLIVADNYRAFEIYAAVALIYLVLTLLASRVFSLLERRMNPSNNSRKVSEVSTQAVKE